ncbi:MAG TPA: mechanosensitive ion channel family protein [Lentisphaerae bacterium]|nr:mechanosensitive ion channel family protein [Lentisphaerota bacterium]
MVSEWLNFKIAGNEIWRIAWLFIVLLGSLIVGRLLRMYCARLARWQRQSGKEMGAVALESTGRGLVPLVFAAGLNIGLQFLVLAERFAGIAATAIAVLITFAVGYLAFHLVDVIDFGLGRLAAKTRSRLDDMMVPMVRKSLRITIVILVLVQIAQTLSDKPLTSIIAGLGVGGLAVALAAQETLKNFFGSLVIFADKPFELGDRIVVDGFDGPVEEVGFRSTRIRTLDGHLVTIPNGELANKTIQNIGKRPYIRRVANITITYDTPPEKVQRAVDIIKEILKDHEGMHPDLPPRVFFNEFNDASLNILVIYWYHPPDYWAFQQFNERVNMEILRRFNAEGIEFAFPTQTLYLAGDPKRPLAVGSYAVAQTPELPGGTA